MENLQFISLSVDDNRKFFEIAYESEGFRKRESTFPLVSDAHKLEHTAFLMRYIIYSSKVEEI